MISIIIASVKPELLANVTKNITETIGVDFEIISFNNSKGEKGLCALYNLGAQKAKYDILCYMHEDIEIKTENWGATVVKIFKMQQPGILAIAGSTYKSSTPSSWFPPTPFGEESLRVLVEQDFKYHKFERKINLHNPKNEITSEVASIDGVWFCTTRTIALNHKFDEELLGGFHGYDIDFSLNVGQQHKILVTFDIMIYHASEGNFDSRWLKEMIKLHQKWNDILPINKNEFDENSIFKKEAKAMKRFLKTMIRKRDFRLHEILSVLNFYFKHKRISRIQFLTFYVWAKLNRIG